jgi:hypothetical protein
MTPQDVLGNESTPIVMSTFDQLEEVDLLTTICYQKHLSHLHMN